jgi:hypothetical protein
MRYEDMLADPQTAFGGLVRFAGLDYNAERVATAVGASSFETLRRQERAAGFRERSARAAAPFFRSGRAGSWRTTLTHDRHRCAAWPPTAQPWRALAISTRLAPRCRYTLDFIGNSFMSRKGAKSQRFSLLASWRLCVRFLIADKDY